MKSLNPRGKLKANSSSFFHRRSIVAPPSLTVSQSRLSFRRLQNFSLRDDNDESDESDSGGRFDDPLGKKTDREIIHANVARARSPAPPEVSLSDRLIILKFLLQLPHLRSPNFLQNG